MSIKNDEKTGASPAAVAKFLPEQIFKQGVKLFQKHHFDGAGERFALLFERTGDLYFAALAELCANARKYGFHPYIVAVFERAVEWARFDAKSRADGSRREQNGRGRRGGRDKSRAEMIDEAIKSLEYRTRMYWLVESAAKKNSLPQQSDFVAHSVAQSAAPKTPQMLVDRLFWWLGAIADYVCDVERQGRTRDMVAYDEFADIAAGADFGQAYGDLVVAGSRLVFKSPREFAAFADRLAQNGFAEGVVRYLEGGGLGNDPFIFYGDIGERLRQALGANGAENGADGVAGTAKKSQKNPPRKTPNSNLNENRANFNNSDANLVKVKNVKRLQKPRVKPKTSAENGEKTAAQTSAKNAAKNAPQGTNPTHNFTKSPRKSAQNAPQKRSAKKDNDNENNP